MSQTLIGHYFFPENPNTPLEHTPGIPWNNPKWFRNWTESLQLLVEGHFGMFPPGCVVEFFDSKKTFLICFCLTSLVTFWPEKLPRWPLGARKTNLSFFVGVVFLKSGPHWQNIGLTYGIVTHPDAIKILRDALPEPRDVTFQNPKKTWTSWTSDTMLTPCWNPENRNETPPIYVSKNVGLKFSSTSTRRLSPILGTPKIWAWA